MTTADEQARLVESKLLELVASLGCGSKVVVTARKFSSDGTSEAFTIDMDPTLEGPAPMSVIVDGGTIYYLFLGKHGRIEFVNDDSHQNTNELLAVIRRVMEHGLIEQIAVGMLRVVTRQRIESPTGPESICYVSSWRSTGDRSEVLAYSPFVGL